MNSASHMNWLLISDYFDCKSFVVAHTGQKVDLLSRLRGRWSREPGGRPLKVKGMGE